MSKLYNESFVLYESVYKTYARLYKKDKETAADYIMAVMEFGICGAIPDEDNDVWLYGLDSAIASIASAKDKRAKNIEDGTKGGRQKKDVDMERAQELKAQGMSYDNIAKEMGVSKSTIQRRFDALVSNGVKTQNLNVNDNVNVNENENINEKKEVLLANANNTECLSAGADSPSISLGGGVSIREMTIDNALMLGVDSAALEAAGNDMNKIRRALGF